MKKLLLPLLSFLLLMACEKELVSDKDQDKFASGKGSRISPKITICHHDALTGKNSPIEINETNWSEHQAHGDLRGSCSDVVVTICGKDWMRKNLDVSTYRDGTPIPNVIEDDLWITQTSGAWSYYNNKAANGQVYGKLYNWHAVNDPKGLAPIGWHVATDEEWTSLTDCLGGENLAATSLKATGRWDNDKNNTNTSGFTALPGGERYIGYSPTQFNGIGNLGIWWTSTRPAPYYAILLRIMSTFNASKVIRGNYDFDVSGHSVRCVRD